MRLALLSGSASSSREVACITVRLAYRRPQMRRTRSFN